MCGFKSRLRHQDPAQELKELEKRRKFAKAKKTYTFKRHTSATIGLLEPRQEVGVYALFCIMYARMPDLFPFKIADYDTNKGFDALVLSGNPTTGLDEYKFVEFKREIDPEFNHSFSHLAHIVCWECNLSDQSEVVDINGEKRTLKITHSPKGKGYTRYMLRTDTDPSNIEIYVLKDYLKEKCGIDFRPQGSG